RLKTTGFFTMLTNVGQENPTKRIFRLRRGYGGHVRLRTEETHRASDLISFWSILLEKHDVPPGRCAEMAGIVVRISRPGESVVRNLVPFFARDLASLAANANARVGEESHFDVVLHVGMLPLIRAMEAFADHRLSIFPSRP